MLYYVPIEPYPTRYTADWVKQFETEFRKHEINYTTILGEPLATSIEDGCVLDACGTNYYKFSQLMQIIKLVKTKVITEKDTVLFADLWFPGIEALFYIRNVMKVNFKIYGILHAGTWDKYDFTCRTGMRSWGKYFERSFLLDCDGVFVATDFHKQLILDNLFLTPIEKHTIDLKIHVTGIPFYSEELKSKYDKVEKENIVVFPHRPDVEKHPEIFDEFSKLLPDYKFIKTLDVCKTRDEYFNLLRKSKIMLSFADQETFGFSTVEAFALGNMVIVPNELSYVETIPEQYRYNSLEQAKEMLLNAANNYHEPDTTCLLKWKDSVHNMLTIMFKE